MSTIAIIVGMVAVVLLTGLLAFSAGYVVGSLAPDDKE